MNTFSNKGVFSYANFEIAKNWLKENPHTLEALKTKPPHLRYLNQPVTTMKREPLTIRCAGEPTYTSDQWALLSKDAKEREIREWCTLIRQSFDSKWWPDPIQWDCQITIGMEYEYFPYGFHIAWSPILSALYRVNIILGKFPTIHNRRPSVSQITLRNIRKPEGTDFGTIITITPEGDIS